jgi:hypothetical protein
VNVIRKTNSSLSSHDVDDADAETGFRWRVCAKIERHGRRRHQNTKTVRAKNKKEEKNKKDEFS